MAIPIIKFKGVQGALLVSVEGSDIKLIKKELDKKISETSKFYQGIKFLGVEGQKLTNEEVLDLNLSLKYKYDLDIDLKNIFEDLSNPPIIRKEIEKDIQQDDQIDHLVNEFQDEMTKFIYGTVRSGQEIKSEGHIVIIGDVNPGALIKANGNVVVLGILRGVVYAGLGGNIKSIIAAYKLLATQLRIGNVIGRAPDEKEFHHDAPEVVKLVDGELLIESYLPNR